MVQIICMDRCKETGKASLTHHFDSEDAVTEAHFSSPSPKGLRGSDLAHRQTVTLPGVASEPSALSSHISNWASQRDEHSRVNVL